MTQPDKTAVMSSALAAELSAAFIPIDQAHSDALQENAGVRQMFAEMGAGERASAVFDDVPMLYIPVLGLARVLAETHRLEAQIPKVTALRTGLMDALYHGGLAQVYQAYPTHVAAEVALASPDPEVRVEAHCALEIYAGLTALFRMDVVLPETDSTRRIRSILVGSCLLLEGEPAATDAQLVGIYQRLRHLR